MAPWQERVVEEKNDLDIKLQKLRYFIDASGTLGISSEERERLRAQAVFMECYSSVLGKRIAAFE